MIKVMCTYFWRIITVPHTATTAKNAVENNANNLNNPVVDNAKNIDEVTLMYNLMEYSDNCFKKSWSLWQLYSGRRAVNNTGVIVAFDVTNITDSLNFKKK